MAIFKVRTASPFEATEAKKHIEAALGYAENSGLEGSSDLWVEYPDGMWTQEDVDLAVIGYGYEINVGLQFGDEVLFTLLKWSKAKNYCYFEVLREPKEVRITFFCPLEIDIEWLAKQLQINSSAIKQQ